MNILFIIIAFVISVCVARLIIPRILLISFRKKLFDIPDERKVHKRAIPRLGGVSFFPTILLSCSVVLALRALTGYGISILFATYILPEFLVLICGMVLLYLTGIADDLVGVRYRQKFMIQLICACLFPISGLWINDFYGLFGIYQLSAWFGIPFTILTVIFITNAINLIDGIDGLASGLSSAALLVLGFLFIDKGLWIYSMLAFSTFGVLVPFFYYNVFGSAEHARKIFMGDTGSLALGGFVAGAAYMMQMPLFILLIGLIYLVEVLSVMIQVTYFKATHGKRIFKMAPIHHHFELCGWSETRIVAVFSVITAVMCLIALLAM